MQYTRMSVVWCYGLDAKLQPPKLI